MADPTTLQNQFDRGCRQDQPRNALPKGFLWYCTDMLPNIGAPLRERGGYTYASGDIHATKSTASRVEAGIYATFAAGSVNVVIDEDGEVYKVASDGTVTDVGAGVATLQNPVLHRDKLVIPASGGSTAPKKVTNSAGTLTLASLGGAPPDGQYADLFNDYTMLGNVSGNPQRLYFSDPGDPESWDTTNSYWDFTHPINAVKALRTAILVFHDGYISRLRGSTPPPGSDFIADDPLFSVGCPDARSIATRGDRVVFANGEGVWYTDGSADPADLSQLCGMQAFYQQALAGYDSSTWTLVGGFNRSRYFVVAMDGSTLKLAAMIDLDRLSWWPLTNIDACSMWPAQGVTDELYFGRRGAARVGALSSIFLPSSTVKNDGDGTAVAGTVELPYYEGDFGAKRWKTLYIDHELTDYGSDNPTATIGVIKTPELTVYTSLTDGLAESTSMTTTKADLCFRADGLGVKLTRANAGDFKLYGIEAEVSREETSRRAA